MFPNAVRRLPAPSVLFSLVLLLWGCASTGETSFDQAPSTAGTHTVMGRGFFPGGVMVWIDARVHDGVPSGTMEYSRVESRGENSFRVWVNVECVGIFKDDMEAVVAGKVNRVDGDYRGTVGIGDWWVLQLEEGGQEGDRIVSQRYEQNHAMDLCQWGPTSAATLQAVDGDLSIH